MTNVEDAKKATSKAAVPVIPDADHFSNAEEHAAWIRSQVRKPWGSYQQKLAYAKRQGYYRHWFNDEPGRIESAIAHGYAHVKEQGKPVKRPVGTAKQGGVLYGYLLEIPEVIWREDKAAEQQEISDQERRVKAGAIAKRPGDGLSEQDGSKFYTPREGITFKEGTGRGKSGL